MAVGHAPADQSQEQDEYEEIRLESVGRHQHEREARSEHGGKEHGEDYRQGRRT